MKAIERSVSFDEAMSLWRKGKMVCVEIDGVEYGLNAIYTEERKLSLLKEQVERGNWTVIEYIRDK